MKILTFRSRKSWRYFSKSKKSTHIIRKICYGALILEAALFIRDFKTAGVHITREEQRETVLIEGNSNGDEADTIQLWFGIHVRIKEGIIEFYRKEEVHRKAKEPVYPDRF